VFVVPSAGLSEDEGEPEEPAGASVEPDEEPDEREAAEVGSVRQWTMDNWGVVTGHVSEEDVRASLLELAVNVAAVVRHPDGIGFYSEDDLYHLLGQHLCLLEHFVLEQVGDDGLCGDDGPYRGRFSGRAEDVLRELGISAPQEVLDAMGRFTAGSLENVFSPPVVQPVVPVVPGDLELVQQEVFEEVEVLVEEVEEVVLAVSTRVSDRTYTRGSHRTRRWPLNHRRDLNGQLEQGRAHVLLRHVACDGATERGSG